MSLPTGLFPLLGPFQGEMIPEYIGTYFWVEVSSPSEWMFMIGTVAILAESYRDMIPPSGGFLTDTLKKGALTLVVVMLLIMGLYLVLAGLMNTNGTFMTPTYPPVPTVLAGMLALFGAIILQRETFATPWQAEP